MRDEKIDEVYLVNSQSDTSFMVQNRSFRNNFTFHFDKFIIKT
jgi:hypothetical protein